eukprot:4244736-Pyramimonas_sp.AAC.1
MKAPRPSSEPMDRTILERGINTLVPHIAAAVVPERVLTTLLRPGYALISRPARTALEKRALALSQQT